MESRPPMGPRLHQGYNAEAWFECSSSTGDPLRRSIFTSDPPVCRARDLQEGHGMACGGEARAAVHTRAVSARRRRGGGEAEGALSLEDNVRPLREALMQVRAQRSRSCLGAWAASGGAALPKLTARCLPGRVLCPATPSCNSLATLLQLPKEPSVEHIGRAHSRSCPCALLQSAAAPVPTVTRTPLARMYSTPALPKLGSGSTRATCTSRNPLATRASSHGGVVFPGPR